VSLLDAARARAELEPAERGRILLRIAWEVVARSTGRPLPADPEVRRAPFLRRHGAVFVSLHRPLAAGRSELRGCLGTLEPFRPLIDDLDGNASAVVDRDPRFPPVSADELDRLALEVTEIEPLRALETRNRDHLLALLRPGIDGLVVRHDGRQATFLPRVWEGGQVSPEQFVSALLEKAGLPRGFWSAELELLTYETRSWSSCWPGSSRPPM